MNLYMHWCIMYKYGIQNMYDDDEILQNILFKESKPNTNNYTNLKSIHVFLSQHAMKILQYVVMWKWVASPVWMLGWFWDLGLINLAALFYGAPLLLHGVHGCLLSGCVCCKVQGRRRLVLMKDGAELMKEDGRQRRTVGSRIGRVDCWIGRLLEEAKGMSRGIFWGGAEKMEGIIMMCERARKEWADNLVSGVRWES